jgi:hypothetical protein
LFNATFINNISAISWRATDSKPTEKKKLVMNPSVDNLSVQIIFQGVLVLTLSSRGLSHLDLDQRKWQFKYPEHGLVSGV